MQNVVPLQFLRTGETGRVYEIEGELGLVTRLNEMGVREGAHVRMVRSGEPCIIALDDHRLTFRGGEAASVLVDVTQVATAEC